jgi:hypothetical protein
MRREEKPPALTAFNALLALVISSSPEMITTLSQTEVDQLAIRISLWLSRMLMRLGSRGRELRAGEI